jgi:hypothetical protein
MSVVLTGQQVFAVVLIGHVKRLFRFFEENQGV